METINCIIWNADPVLFEIGPVTLRWYGLMFGSGLLIGYFLLRWQFNRAEHNEELPRMLFFYVYFGTIVGAFLGHRIFYKWDELISDPLSTLSLLNGLTGLSSHGATIGIIISVYFYKRKYRIPYIEIGDRMSFGIAVVAASVRVGNLMNSEIVGRKTDVPWAFCFPRFDHDHLVPRHPSQIYEICIGIFIFAILMIADKLAGGEKRPVGLLSGIFLIGYFSMRFAVEFFKEYHTLPKDFPVTMGQILSVPFIIFGAFVLYQTFKKNA